MSRRMSLTSFGPACAKCATGSERISRKKRREAHGKREVRGASFLGTAEHPSQRKQVFAAALKRVNSELRRLHNLAALTANVEAARRALALRRSANFSPHPSAGDTFNEGTVPRPMMRRRETIPGQRPHDYRRQRKPFRRYAMRGTREPG